MLFRDYIPSRGLHISTAHPTITPETKASLFFGMYEPDEVLLVKKFARTDLDVVDVGSSLGVIASHIGRRLDHGRRLVCVEANVNLLDRLGYNLHHNAPSCNFTVLHAAIHYEATKPLAFKPGVTNIDGTVQLSTLEVQEAHVPPLTLDTLVSDLSISRYLLICDIEGSEAGIILDDRSL
jgi:FkbM family methyltransferase